MGRIYDWSLTFNNRVLEVSWLHFHLLSMLWWIWLFLTKWRILVLGKKPWYALLDYSRLWCWLQDILLLDVTKHMWKFLVLLVPSLHLLLHVKHHSPQILFWSHDHTTHLIISFGVCVCLAMAQDSTND